MSIVSSILSTGDSSSLNRKVQFVGSGWHRESNGGATDFPLSTVDIKAGDLIIFQRCSGSVSVDTGPMATPTGFTLLNSVFANDTYDVSMETYYKIADGTEDAVSFTTVSDTSASMSVSVMVFRGTDGTAPAIFAEGTTSNTDDITWPKVIGLSSDSVAVYIGASSHSESTLVYTDPGDLDFFDTDYSNDTYDHSFGFGYKQAGSNPTFSASDWLLSSATPTSSATASAILIIQ